MSMGIDIWSIELTKSIKNILEKKELIYVGITDLQLGANSERYVNWLQHGKHAGMRYLAEHIDIRCSPEKLVEGAKSAVVFAMPIFRDENTASFPKVARYAQIIDYHCIMKKLGAGVINEFCNNIPMGTMHFRCVVDSAPVLERALAAKTSFGFIGKNTCFISPNVGSFLLLGEIFTPLAATSKAGKKPANQPNKPPAWGCGDCKSCKVHCPTGALDTEYLLDARLCLSYWTIEHRGTIPKRFWPYLSNCLFGCDICQNICPYNRVSRNPAVLGSSAVHGPSHWPDRWKTKPLPPIFEIATMDQKKYEAYFGGTSLTRAKRNGLRRNALIAMYVMNDPRLVEAVDIASHDAPYPVDATIAEMGMMLLF